MNLTERIREIFRIDRMIAALERHQQARVAQEQPEPIQHPKREQYLSALAKIRYRIANSADNQMFDAFSVAYFNIINQGVSERIFTWQEHDGLVSQMVDASVEYLVKKG